MLKNAGSQLIGTFSILFYALNTIFWATPIILLSFLKLIPIGPWRRLLSYFLDGCATAWISVNNFNQSITSRTKWTVTGSTDLNPKDWYLVISNHQSWVDILVLQRIFNRKIPFLKFFLKQELIWVPVLGIAWWALDFPFMRRYSKSFLAKNPHMKGKDMETTRQACEKFRFKPVSIMNFVEGTRYTAAKHKRQNGPFTHLLKPKAGGIAFVLSAMSDKLNKLIDVTIDYPNGIPSFWDFVCGKVKEVRVNIAVMPIKDIIQSGAFAPDYFDNPEQRARFQQWLNLQWQQKDAFLDSINCSKTPL